MNIKEMQRRGKYSRKSLFPQGGGDIRITGILFSLEGESRLRTFLQNVYYQKRTGG